MPIHNADIATVFEEIADLLEIENANPFRIRAYRNAARTILELGRDAQELVEKGEDLSKLPGIGKELSAKIVEIVQTGRCHALEKLRKKTPPGLPELLKTGMMIKVPLAGTAFSMKIKEVNSAATSLEWVLAISKAFPPSSSPSRKKTFVSARVPFSVSQ